MKIFIFAIILLAVDFSADPSRAYGFLPTHIKMGSPSADLVSSNSIGEYRLAWQDNILGYSLIGLGIALPSFLGYMIWEGRKERRLRRAPYESITKADK